MISTELFIVIAIVCCVPLWVIGVYNRFVMLRNLVDSVWRLSEAAIFAALNIISNIT